MPSNEADTAKLAVWKEALYERCREAGDSNGGLFSQDDLLRLDVIPNRDAILLMRVVQSLSDDKLFVTMREASGNVLWKWRDAQEAHKSVFPFCSLYLLAAHCLGDQQGPFCLTRLSL
jgi:DNA-directed RNA polymerase III subunit RPC6